MPMETLHTPAGEDNEKTVCDVDSLTHLNTNLIFIYFPSYDVI